MRRQRQWNLRIDISKDSSMRGKRIQSRRPRFFKAVRAQMVCTECVYGDENDRSLRGQHAAEQKY